nr:sterol desaturase family protein [Endozoicomonas sp. OPT23]
MAQAALALVVAEFGVYWEHRWFHTKHYLWRFHAVHHCVRRLTFLNALQSHFFDLIWVGVAIALGLTVFGAPEEMAMIVAIFTVLHGKWQHGNIRYKLGWMNYIFSAAELHRWHHSVRYQDADSNYGSNLIVWDLVFGTYNLPKDRELDVVGGIGLGRDDATFPKTWWGQLIVPFFWEKMVGNRHYYPDQKKKQEAKAAAANS